MALTGTTNLMDALVEAGWAAGARVSEHPLIICCGHGRTGTTSLTLALQGLGLRAEHYTAETMALVRAAERSGADAVDWSAFEAMDAVLDAPVPSFYLELLRRFPRARVILTVREPRAWLRSHRGHYSKFTREQPAAVLPGAPLQLNRRSNTYYAPGMDASPNRLLDFGTNDPSDDQALRRYIGHNLEVMRTVPPDQLLVMDIAAGDGWDKLCAFLGRERPAGAFPHANASA